MELLSRTCNTDRANIERIIARVFVILGGLFWIFMVYGARTDSGYTNAVFSSPGVRRGLIDGLAPLGLTIVVFVLGLFYERLTALLLVVAAAALVAYGIFAGWETGVWMTIAAVIIAPMLIAAALYWLAGRMEQICLLEQQAAH